MPPAVHIRKKASMVPFRREEPRFALCGLNCCLCPRFHTEGASRCPGCGGEGFPEKHPSCAVVSCSRRHDGVEFCFECGDYPCERYEDIGKKDSFITYRNVTANLEEAGRDLEGYLSVLKTKFELLKLLTGRFNTGRSKSLYCLAVELLPLDEIRWIIDSVERETDGEGSGRMSKSAGVAEGIRKRAAELGIELVLRK